MQDMTLGGDPMNDNKRFFNIIPDTVPFTRWIRLATFKYNGKYGQFLRARSPTEKGANLIDILLDNGEIIRNINQETDLKYNLIQVLCGEDVIEVCRDQNGNNTNPKSQYTRQLEKINKELRDEINQLKTNLSQYTEVHTAREMLEDNADAIGHIKESVADKRRTVEWSNLGGNLPLPRQETPEEMILGEDKKEEEGGENE